MTLLKKTKWINFVKFRFILKFFYKAYSIRDEEVGYCQGLSFVIATILIHVKENEKELFDINLI